MLKVENKILDFIYKHKFVIFAIIITAISIAARVFLMNYESGDYTAWLLNWFNEIKANGGLHALDKEIGNYNAPYMTIIALLTYLPINSLYSIKIVSIVFDYVLAFGVCRIIYILFKDKKNKNMLALIMYGVVIMWPTVLLNSACWGQADSIYTAFVVWSLAFLLQEKYLRAFILLGAAFAFKLQFIFILPLYICLYISKRKFSILYFLIIPAVDFILSLPAIMFGKPISSLVTTYTGQAQLYADKLSMNFPNIYNLIFPVEGNHTYQTFLRTK